MSIPEDVTERILSSSPLPIADAFGALAAAESPFEQRDRVVEVFRAALRTVSALTLAARVQFGPGPGPEPAQLPELYRSLRSRGLTDGQWFAIVREALRPWASAPGSYPLPELVPLVHGKKAEWPKLVDELLVMRKSETVAHGASGTKAAIIEILARRVPQLVRFLGLLEPIWARTRLLVPLSVPDVDDEPQAAWSLMGYTPPRGRWRRVMLAPGVRLTPGEAVLTDADHKPILALHPIILVRRPSPEMVEEVFTLDGGSKKGAVFVALPSMAEHRETDAWAVLSKAFSAGDGAEEAPAEGDVDRPFRGLASFGPEHAALFFGREEQAEALANRIRRDAFVTVVGPSGSGKTSLLCAGALPQLKEYKVIVMRPGALPLESLRHRLAEGLSGVNPDIERILRDDPAKLSSAYRTVTEASLPPVALVVDQAEELFTLCPDDEQRASFARALAAFGASPDSPLRVVMSVREDFFGRFATLSALRGLYSRTVEVVTAPDRDALARTLYLPAKHFGYTFEDEALVLEMVDAVKGEPAALALLQFCADRLWEVRDRTWKRLTWDAYRAQGGVSGALAAHADRTVVEMSPNAERVVRSLLLRLVTPDRTRAVVFRKELLEAVPSADRGEAEVILDRLIAARLLTAGEADDGGGARVEIVHEALIRHWGRLATWLSEDVEGQRLLHAVRQAAREWDGRSRARGLLWSGDALSELVLWRKRAADGLSGLEAAFFDASLAEERRGKRLRRGILLAAFAATLGFGTFMLWQWRRAESARVETEKAQERAEARGLVSEARSLEPSGKATKALSLLRAAAALESRQLGPAPTEVSVEMERLARSGAANLALTGHGAQIRTLAVSPNRDRLVTASADGTARAWDARSGAALFTLGDHGGELCAVAYTSDGRSILTAANAEKTRKGTLRLWDGGTGQLRRAIDLSVAVRGALFTPDGRLVMAALAEGGVGLFDAQTGERTGTLGEAGDSPERLALSADGKRAAVILGVEVRAYDVFARSRLFSFANNAGQVMAITFSPDGAVLAVTSGGTVRLLDAEKGTPIRALETPDQGVYDNGKAGIITSVSFSPDGKLVAAGGMDHLVRVWEAATGELRHALRGHKEQIDTVAFSPDGRLLASAALDGSAFVWDMGSGARVEELRGHEAEIYRIEFVDAGRVATVSYDRTARIWDVTDGPFLRAVGVVRAGIDRTAFSADKSRLAVSSDRTALVLDTSKGAVLGELTGQPAQISALAMAPDGAQAVTGHSDETAVVWDVSPVRARATLSGHEKGVTAALYSNDGNLIITGDAAGTLRLWDAKTGEKERELREHKSSISVVVTSEGSRLMASGARDGTAVIWEASTGRMLHVLKHGEDPIMAMAFSRDEKTLATGQFSEALLWDVDTGKLRATLGGYEQAVMALAYSPDQKSIAALSSDGVLGLWSLADGARIRELRVTDNGSYDVAFSADGERLLMASGEGRARVWHVPTGALLDTLSVSTRSPGLSVDRVVPLGEDQVLTVSRDGSVLLFREPRADRNSALIASGERTTYRVCRASFRVVAVLPAPPPDSVWAPDAACAPAPLPPGSR